MQRQGYCVRCKKMIDIKDGQVVTWPNGRRALKGTCPNCNTGVNAILPKNA
ncbi:MAG: DUF5679 domain-containing protein [bacterium]|nr:DUF5679 domain-containing protein [bacterium]